MPKKEPLNAQSTLERDGRLNRPPGFAGVSEDKGGVGKDAGLAGVSNCIFGLDDGGFLVHCVEDCLASGLDAVADPYAANLGHPLRDLRLRAGHPAVASPSDGEPFSFHRITEFEHAFFRRHHVVVDKSHEIDPVAVHQGFDLCNDVVDGPEPVTGAAEEMIAVVAGKGAAAARDDVHAAIHRNILWEPG